MDWMPLGIKLILKAPVKYAADNKVCFCLFVFDSLHHSQQSFSNIWTGLPGLNQY